MSKKRIGLLTGGGDVPGLNTVIKSVVYRAEEIGAEVLGIRRGWEGLTHLQFAGGADPSYIIPLNRQNTRTIDRAGGTFLHTSRTNPLRMTVAKLPERLQKTVGNMKEVSPGVVDFSPIVLDNLQSLRIDVLIAVGGDDTLSFARALDGLGFPVVGIPKTMDNDVNNSEYCIGFSTAITRAEAAISRQRSSIGSHERIGIFRVFGRDVGHTALYTAYVTGGTRCCIPEHRFDLDLLLHLLLADKKDNPSNYALVILSEGAIWSGAETKEYGEPDAFGHRKKVNIGEMLSDEIQRRTGEGTIISDLTYDLRSGPPDFVDRMVATTFANVAIDLIMAGGRGRMIAVQNGCFTDAAFPDPARGPRRVDVSRMYSTARLRPNYTGKRGVPVFLAHVPNG